MPHLLRHASAAATDYTIVATATVAILLLLLLLHVQSHAEAHRRRARPIRDIFAPIPHRRRLCARRLFRRLVLPHAPHVVAQNVLFVLKRKVNSEFNLNGNSDLKLQGGAKENIFEFKSPTQFIREIRTSCILLASKSTESCSFLISSNLGNNFDTKSSGFNGFRASVLCIRSVRGIICREENRTGLEFLIKNPANLLQLTALATTSGSLLSLAFCRIALRCSLALDLRGMCGRPSLQMGNYIYIYFIFYKSVEIEFKHKSDNPVT